MNKLTTLIAALVLLSGCELLQQGAEHCDEAEIAIGLICDVAATIPVGAAGGEVTDPNKADCVILQEGDKVPLEYCR